MSDGESMPSQGSPAKPRHDGWTHGGLMLNMCAARRRHILRLFDPAYLFSLPRQTTDAEEVTVMGRAVKFSE